MKKPQGCKTPYRDTEEYKLTVSDFRYMEQQAIKINKMLSYYVNMPENRTGELATVNTERLCDLLNKIEDIKITLEDVIWR